MLAAESVDVLVIGGGPAGSTAASVLKRFHPTLRVVLVEQATFPRYHIGESLILELNRILEDMGALEDVRNAGFLKKGGSTFVWGKDREPWFLLFPEADFMRHDPNPDMFGHTWHVERSVYDSVLLNVAKRHGTEVLQPAKVVDLIDGDNDAIAGAVIEDADGVVREIHAKYVIDAGGRNGPIARRRSKRIWDPVLRNVATYGYWKGVELDPKYSMTWDLSLINVIAIPIGWIWFIPVREGIVSCGVVTSHERFSKREEHDLQEFYLKYLATCPEVSKWIAHAELIEFDLAGKKVLTEMDFNYAHDHLHGPGWVLAGDAAGFVDPLFSLGVYLAQTGGQMAAYAVGTALAAKSEEEATRALAAYQHHMQSHMASFRQMAYVFYGFNLSREGWWERTRELIRNHALPTDIADRDAFMAAVFGFGINVSLFSEATAMLGQMLGVTVRDALLGKSESASPVVQFDRTAPVRPTARPKLVRPYQVVTSAVPIDGTGRMVPMSRIEFAPMQTSDTSAIAAFPRHIYVPDEMVILLGQLDGTKTVMELERSTVPSTTLSHFPKMEPQRFVGHMLKALAGLGALEGV